MAQGIYIDVDGDWNVFVCTGLVNIDKIMLRMGVTQEMLNAGKLDREQSEDYTEVDNTDVTVYKMGNMVYIRLTDHKGYPDQFIIKKEDWDDQSEIFKDVDVINISDSEPFNIDMIHK